MAQAASVAGRWQGVAQAKTGDVPFDLQVRQNGLRVEAAFLNGPERAPAAHASFSGGVLTLDFPDYANRLQARLRDGVLSGTFGGHLTPIPITAHRVRSGPAVTAVAPNIGGRWTIPVHGPKGESSWSLRVDQRGGHARAVVQRIDGDTGYLYGDYRAGVFLLSHFTGAGPALLRLQPQPDGTLKLLRAPRHLDLIARRAPADAVMTAADDPLRHTWMQNPTQPLHFRFPALEGGVVGSMDARFRGKVVIVAVGGSWCPNCHDEAPLLESLYRRYHRRGLEVVSLFFEEKEQLASRQQVRTFVHEYGITYPMLLAGTPDQLASALPQAVNLNCWPTTFFVGRDGLVKRIHTGFAGPADRPAHAALVRETDRYVRTLLGAR